MRIHPVLDDPRAVLISRTPVSDPVHPEDYRAAARQAIEAMQIELQGENVVIKPNVTAGEQTAVIQFPRDGPVSVFDAERTLLRTIEPGPEVHRAQFPLEPFGVRVLLR